MDSFFSSSGFMPHIHCYLAKPALVWTMFGSDLMIGIAYLGISITLWALVKKTRIPFNFIVVCFGVFILACGVTHFMEVWTLWRPDYWVSAGIKVVTAAASVGTGIYLFQLRHAIVTVATASKLSEQRRLDLEALTKNLESRVEERTHAIKLSEERLRASEQQLRVLADSLQEAVRLRDEFLSIASHELKTPLTSLKMQSQMRQRWIDGGNLSSADQKFMALLANDTRQIDRLTRLIDDMLDISRITAGKLALHPETFDLRELVRETIDRQRPQLEAAGCTVALEPGEPVLGQWDRFRIEQVITNLLTNAMKYGAGKPVAVTLARAVAGGARLTVADQGIGIAPEDQARIFDRFERAVSPSSVGGLGLGLYISRQIVEQHGGTISVESRVGQGSRFAVELPPESGAHA